MLADYIKQPINTGSAISCSAISGPPPILQPPVSGPPMNFGPPPTSPPPIQKPDPPALQQMTLFEYHDRYEYSPSDSELWMRLFMYADREIGQDAATMLELIRNTGAVLQPSQQYGYIIRPIIGAQGWSSMEEYEQERSPLLKHQIDVIRILKRLAEVR